MLLRVKVALGKVFSVKNVLCGKAFLCKSFCVKASMCKNFCV